MEENKNVSNMYQGIICANELSDNAEYQRVLRAVERGELIRLRHGVYASPESVMNTMIDVEKIIPGGVVCLYTAWMHYQLSTMVPPAFCIAVEAKRKVILPDIIPVNLYYWKKENLDFGIIEQEISGYKVRITDIERSVCDAIKYRNKIGLEVCSEVIRSYLKRNDRNLSRLTEYAKKLRVKRTLDNYLAISLE